MSLCRAQPGSTPPGPCIMSSPAGSRGAPSFTTTKTVRIWCPASVGSPRKGPFPSTLGRSFRTTFTCCARRRRSPSPRPCSGCSPAMRSRSTNVTAVAAISSKTASVRFCARRSPICGNSYATSISTRCARACCEISENSGTGPGAATARFSAASPGPGRKPGVCSLFSHARRKRRAPPTAVSSPPGSTAQLRISASSGFRFPPRATGPR